MSKLQMMLDEQTAKVIIETVKTIMSKTKENSTNWKSKSPAVIAGSAIIIIALAAAIAFFIATTRIAPLMILLAVLMPLLCFGIYQASQTIDIIHKEFHEYNEAVDALMKLIEEAKTNDDDTAIDTAMANVVAESEDVCEIVDALDMGAADAAKDLETVDFIDVVNPSAEEKEAPPEHEMEAPPEDAVEEIEKSTTIEEAKEEDTPKADIIPVDIAKENPEEDLTLRV